MKNKTNILHTSGKITLAFLAFVLMFICWIGNVFSYGTQSGTLYDSRRGSRVTDYMLYQPFENTYTFYFGTQSVTGSGTTGYITGTSTALPRLQYNASALTFNFVGAALQNEGVDITVSSDLTGYIAVSGGTGTGNVLTNTTLAGAGTISANVNLSGNITANSLLITPTELGYLDNATGEIQAQITTATGSITNHVHTGADGTTQIAHDSVTGTGTNSHATLDTFVSSKAQASGLASLDGNSLVVQNPTNGTTTPTANKIVIADGSGKINNGWLNSTAYPYIAQTSGTGTGITLAGNTNFPSGIWNSSGNVAIGTTTATHPFNVVSGTNIVKFTTAGNMRMGSIGDSETYDGKLTITGANAVPGDAGAILKIIGPGGDELAFGVNDTPTARDIGWIRAFHPGINNNDFILQPDGGNVGIGTTTANNILTLPIASATDPIADSWTNHCLADYKDLGTETAEMIQLSANDKIKSVPVSSFTKKALISDEEAEREVKQKYQDKIRESAKADLELYTTETGVSMRDNSYVDELVNSMWETKADRQTLIESNKQKLIAEKKALPKFQRRQYGIVAEDAPPEAQVLREDGSLQGVDPYPLIGILWANAQKQDERIALLETQIGSLTSRLLVLEGR